MSNDSVVALSALRAVFGALGRIVLCLDGEFRLVHASEPLPRFAAGASIADAFGDELFGPGGSLRSALEAGERREGWRAFLRTGNGLRLFSVSAAPLHGMAVADAVRYVVVLQPAEEAIHQSGAIWLSGLVARAPAMQRVFEVIQDLQGSTGSVLLTGESGTGREAVARVIHEQSPRRNGPFVVINCAALPADLVSARLEHAGNGTLFLDEVGNLPLALQDKLLAALHERTFPRIIAATKADLARAVRSGKFREDLYDALRVVPIEIPPLRARREDVEPLASVLLARAGERQGRQQLRFAPETIRRLLGHSWPGNVRELENAIEYAVGVAKGPILLPEDLPPELMRLKPGVSGGASPEAERIRAALESVQWRREAAAASLRISRTTLWRKMREHGLAGGVSR